MDEHLEKLVDRLKGLMDSGVLLPSEVVQAIQALAMMNLVKQAERIANWCDAHWNAEGPVMQERD